MNTFASCAATTWRDYFFDNSPHFPVLVPADGQKKQQRTAWRRARWSGQETAQRPLRDEKLGDGEQGVEKEEDEHSDGAKKSLSASYRHRSQKSISCTRGSVGGEQGNVAMQFGGTEQAL